MHALHARVPEFPLKLARYQLVRPKIVVAPDRPHVVEVGAAPHHVPVRAPLPCPALLLVLHNSARLARQPERRLKPVDRLRPLPRRELLVRPDIDRRVIQRPIRSQCRAERIHFLERPGEVGGAHAAQLHHGDPLVRVGPLQVLGEVARIAARVALNHHGQVLP